MNIVCLFGILLIAAKTSGFPEASQHKESQQRTLLRKLLGSQQDGTTNSESITWNEILADALVTKLHIFPKNNVDKTNKSIAKTLLSEILIIYKSVYDKYNPKSSVNEDVVNLIRKKLKDEVEVVRLDHKENCDQCDGDDGVLRVEKDVECVEGFVQDKDGDCVPAPSKLILAVPNQCPAGYRADRMGFCRISF